MSVEKLQAEAAKAQETVDAWEAKAAAARAEVDEAERGSGAAIIADPDAAEGITLKVQTLERKARAYDAAADEARLRMRPVYRKHVELEAKELDKSAASLRKDADRHNAKVEDLLAKLKDLDGVEYQPRFGQPARLDNDVYRPAEDGARETVGQDLEGLAAGAEAQANLIRFILANGRGPTAEENNADMPYNLPVPPVTQAALDAGAL